MGELILEGPSYPLVSSALVVQVEGALGVGAGRLYDLVCGARRRLGVLGRLSERTTADWMERIADEAAAAAALADRLDEWSQWLHPGDRYDPPGVRHGGIRRHGLELHRRSICAWSVRADEIGLRNYHYDCLCSWLLREAEEIGILAGVARDHTRRFVTSNVWS